MRAVGESIEADAGALHDAELTLTEACSNAVRHAYPGGDGTLVASIDVRDGAFHTLVRDAGRGMETVPPPPSRQGGGLGLKVIDALVDDVEIRSERGLGTEIAMALEIVFETLELLVRAVTFFAELWVAELRVAGTAVGGLIQIMIGLLDVVLGAFQGILDGADAAFGWLPGVGSKIDNAKTALSGFRDDAVSKLQGIATAASNLGVNLDRANKKRKLEADISSFQHQLEKARADLKRTSDQKARSKLKGDISDLEAKLAAARRKLNALNGKTATTYVRTVQYGIGAEAANAARRAHGGVIGSRVGKAATGGVRNNLTMVGEQGPELVELPGGSRVRSNPDTRRIMSHSQAIRPRR